jgi:quercetin dioxygenase-like cupin family protein
VKLIRWNDLEPEQLNPLLARQMISGEHMTMARITLRKGCVVPEHSHLNEQFAFVLEGALRFTFSDKEVVVRAGEVLCIPPHVPHKAEALEDTIDLDVFSPVRADWVSGQDQYLRR